MTATAAKLPDWLSDAPAQDGLIHISDPRRYAHDEAAYDAYYDSDPDNFRVGKGLVQLLKSRRADTSAEPVLSHWALPGRRPIPSLSSQTPHPPS
jgi:hypothetical protein